MLINRLLIKKTKCKADINGEQVERKKFTRANFQEICDFWLGNCVNSNDYAYNLKRIAKWFFLEHFSKITVLIL